MTGLSLISGKIDINIFIYQLVILAGLLFGTIAGSSITRNKKYLKLVAMISQSISLLIYLILGSLQSYLE